MAKSWQYGRWRAVVLQAVMWVVFGSSLGLAAFIDHRRSGTLDVRLGQPVPAGRLIVRLPLGWEVLAQRQGEAEPATTQAALQVLTAVDFDRQGRERRRLTITQEQQSGRPMGAEYYLDQLMTSRHVLPLEPQPFSMLGQDDGVLIPFKVNLKRYLRRARVEDLPDPGLYACVVTPDGLAVTVQVTGDGAYGPSSHRLLRLVTDNMRLADAPSDAVSATVRTR